MGILLLPALKQDAAGLTQLSSTVEDVFASGDLPKAAETLANMRHCLSAVGEVIFFIEFLYILYGLIVTKFMVWFIYFTFRLLNLLTLGNNLKFWRIGLIQWFSLVSQTLYLIARSHFSFKTLFCYIFSFTCL